MKKLALMATIFIMIAVLLLPLSQGTWQVAYASPANERQSPDAILLQTNLSGNVTAIQDDPDTPDANWLDAIDDAANTVAHVSFPTPTGNPTQGAGLQEFKIWVKKFGDLTKTPTVQIDLYESGILVAVVMAASDVTISEGQLFSGTWDASLLGTPDGSAVECYITGVKSLGAPPRATVSVGAVEWNVEYTAAPADISNTPNFWNLGTVVADSTYQTGLSYFTITNNSSYNVTISIHGEDMAGTGADWILSNLGTPGTNTYGLMAGRPDLGDYTIIVKRDPTYETLVSNLGASANQSWGLKFWAPEAPFPDYGYLKSANVTLTAAQS